jgi:hypothetical protein
VVGNTWAEELVWVFLELNRWISCLVLHFLALRGARSMDSLWSVGFDIRINRKSDDPLSADPVVWPSALNGLRQLPAFERKFQYESNWIDLLPNLASLLALVPNARELGTIVEIRIPSAARVGLRGFAGVTNLMPLSDPDAVNRFTVSGYDVIDPRTLTSALFIKPELPEVNGAIATLGKLAATYEHAEKLAILATKKYVEHAPFFVAEVLELRGKE